VRRGHVLRGPLRPHRPRRAALQPQRRGVQRRQDAPLWTEGKAGGGASWAGHGGGRLWCDEVVAALITRSPCVPCRGQARVRALTFPHPLAAPDEWQCTCTEGYAAELGGANMPLCQACASGYNQSTDANGDTVCILSKMCDTFADFYANCPSGRPKANASSIPCLVQGGVAVCDAATCCEDPCAPTDPDAPRCNPNGAVCSADKTRPFGLKARPGDGGEGCFTGGIDGGPWPRRGCVLCFEAASSPLPAASRRPSTPPRRTRRLAVQLHRGLRG
jgi:hypothetical protein